MEGASWHGKILRVDLTDRTSAVENLSQKIYQDYIGGKGLGSYLLYRDLKAGIDSLSKDNILLFMTGPLQGLSAPNVGRWTLVTKSPLTGLYLDTHCGGPLGREIKNAGYDAIAVVGKSDVPITLIINDSNIEFRNAQPLWGKGTHEATHILHEQTAKGSAVYVIGPAGENLVLSATGCCELAHQTGRGGAGAVLGSKNLKGVVARGTSKLKAADPTAIREVNRTVTKIWNEKTGYGFKEYGTPFLVEISNERGQFPTRNFRNGYFDEYESLTPEKMREWYIGAHLSCPHCIMRCTHAYRTEDPRCPGTEVESTVEYETLGLLGGTLGINNAQCVFQLNHLCDDLGLDTIGAGSAIGFAMEAYERGLLSEDEIGFPLPFGDCEGAKKLVEMIAAREGIGAVLAKGTRLAAKEIGKGSETFAVHVKGLEVPAWDPRGKRGMGLSYATGDVGASHLRGWPQTLDNPDTSALDVVESMVEQRYIKILRDSLIVCHLSYHLPLSHDQNISLLNGATGLNYDVESISIFGQRIETLTRLFNNREGVSRKDDVLPPRLWESETHGPAKGMKSFIDQDDFERSLDKYYELLGWGMDGIPTRKTIEKLGLGSQI
ncbi:MAG: aldehyde:ferredoxin oxidoreductase [Candidatus Thorarchaeota archaeon]|nr:MAG: aldehyde:ferredoxin oxidoreductase [Candidatus Thorarchaeota archaeon]